MDRIVDYTIKMIRYALANEVPALPDDMDFEKLYIFCSRHGVENMLYSSMRRLKVKLPVKVASGFKSAYELQIMLEAKQTLELDALGRELDKAGIDYMPLKGSIVRQLYPMPDFRKSSDIDILIHPEDEERTRPVVKSFGYELSREYEGRESQVVYTRQPYMILEVHRSLLNGGQRSHRLCEHVWDYAKDCGRHCYGLDINFLYVYLIAHIAKHLIDGGAGVKMLTDLWLLKRAGRLDRQEIDKLLELASLTEIENYINRIVEMWYEDKPCGDSLALTLEKFFISRGSVARTAENIATADLGGADAGDIAILHKLIS